MDMSFPSGWGGKGSRWTRARAGSGEVHGRAAVRHGIDAHGLVLGPAHRDQDAAAADAPGIDMRVRFRHACPGQRPQQAASGCAHARAGQRGDEPSGRNAGADVGNAQSAEAGEHAGAASQHGAKRRAGSGARCCALVGVAGRQARGSFVGEAIRGRIGMTALSMVGHKADAGARRAGGFQLLHHMNGIVVAVVKAGGMEAMKGSCCFAPRQRRWRLGQPQTPVMVAKSARGRAHCAAAAGLAPWC